MTDGNSGGPLVDENGAVVGINKGKNDNYYYAISINQVKEVLDALEITYSTTGTTNTPVVEEPTEETEPVIEEVEEETEEVTEEATEVSTVTENGLDLKLIIIIAIIAMCIFTPKTKTEYVYRD